MNILLKRTKKTPLSTIGDLSINGNPECVILEDTDRGLRSDMTLESIKAIKIKGKTCIPSGRYEIVITFSNRFQKPLPLILAVPGFEGIRIHPGNNPANTEGCLLPGTVPGENMVFNSRVAFLSLFNKIKAALNKEKVFITIE